MRRSAPAGSSPATGIESAPNRRRSRFCSRPRGHPDGSRSLIFSISDMSASAVPGSFAAGNSDRIGLTPTKSLIRLAEYLCSSAVVCIGRSLSKLDKSFFRDLSAFQTLDSQPHERTCALRIHLWSPGETGQGLVDRRKSFRRRCGIVKQETGNLRGMTGSVVGMTHGYADAVARADIRANCLHGKPSDPMRGYPHNKGFAGWIVVLRLSHKAPNHCQQQDIPHSFYPQNRGRTMGAGNTGLGGKPAISPTRTSLPTL